jgi:hypothetical protein
MVAIAGLGNEWDDFTSPSGSSVLLSRRNVKDLLRVGLGTYSLQEISTWNGRQNKYQFATGSGQLTCKVLIGEAGGFRKFVKEVALEGVMEHGRFSSEVRLTVMNPSGFDVEQRLLYTDGLITLSDPQQIALFKQIIEENQDGLGKGEKNWKLVPLKDRLDHFYIQIEDLRKKTQRPQDKTFYDNIIEFSKSVASSAVGGAVYDVLKFLGKNVVARGPWARAYLLFRKLF